MDNEKLIKKVGIINSFWLKMIAFVTMTIDHIGYFLFPQLTILRIIGRIAFPIFAFLTAVSMQYTSNKIRYFSVLLGAGLVMCVVTSLYMRELTPNIFIDLGLGALGCFFLHHKTWYSYIGVVLILAFSMTPYTTAQYGVYGIGAIMLLYFLYDKRLISVAALGVWTILCVYLQQIPIMHFHLVQGYFLLLGLPFILIYNEERGFYHHIFKYFFYIYYPLHIVILYFLAKVI